MSLKENLIEIFSEKSAGPFLFVGSGFSRRYLKLEDWRGLLSRFCLSGQPFEYYLASANGNYPAIAKLIADDFNKLWWEDEKYKETREKHKHHIKDKTSALRIEVANYLNTLDQNVAKNSDYKDEIDLLPSLNVDGIITTNWDPFLEQIFPDYNVYIGQEQLLFANPQGIGEIYKIHGCASDPSSLVLTDADYAAFSERNAYLAAKLITIFVEHPIIFIGYSLSDDNIRTMLRSISACIGSKNIENLRKNLIFVQRLEAGENESISESYIVIDGIQIPIIVAKTNDFREVYLAMNYSKRKIPARILRYCKEQLYEIVKSTDPDKKISVVSIDEIENKSDVEFIVGVGVTSGLSTSNNANIAAVSGISEVGYAALDAKEIVEDVIFNSKNFDSKMILEQTIRNAGRTTKYVPVFKYLSETGIHDADKYKASGLQLDKWVCKKPRDFRLGAYVKSFLKNHKTKNSNEIIETCTPENAAIYIPFLKKENIDLETLEVFLKENFHKIEYSASNYASYYRKLACLYDLYKWGW